MFKAGKLYTNYADVPNVPYAECLFADDKNIVLRWTNGVVITYNTGEFFTKSWRDYTPPVIQECTKKVVLSLIKKGNMDLVEMDYPETENEYWKVIGTVKLTATYGKLTGVEVLP